MVKTLATKVNLHKSLCPLRVMTGRLLSAYVYRMGQIKRGQLTFSACNNWTHQ